MKYYYSEAIDYAVRTGDLEFNKVEFLASFTEIRNKTFKKSTI